MFPIDFMAKKIGVFTLRYLEIADGKTPEALKMMLALNSSGIPSLPWSTGGSIQ